MVVSIGSFRNHLPHFGRRHARWGARFKPGHATLAFAPFQARALLSGRELLFWRPGGPPRHPRCRARPHRRGDANDYNTDVGHLGKTTGLTTTTGTAPHHCSLAGPGWSGIQRGPRVLCLQPPHQTPNLQCCLGVLFCGHLPATALFGDCSNTAWGTN